MKRLVCVLFPCFLGLALSCDKGDGPTTDPGSGDADGGADSGGDTAQAGPTALEQLLADMDPAADPCQDFYRYACGGWLDRTQLPPDKPRYGRSFTEIQERNLQTLRKILEDAAAATDADPKTQKLGDFYTACMDTAAAEKAGRAPLDPILARIDAIQDKKQLMAELGTLHGTVFGRVGWLGRTAPPPFFRTGTEPDAIADPKTEIPMFAQSGLGLPSRSMYVGKGEQTKQVLAAYEKHIAAMLALSGEAQEVADKHAAGIVKLETALAKASKEPADLRDFKDNYNKKGYAGLKKLTRGINWDAYFETAGLPKSDNINVGQPKFYKAVATQIKKGDLDTLKAYVRWHVTQGMARYLSSDLQNEAFELDKMTQGVQQLPERWKQCAEETMWAMPELVGEPFAGVAFAGESKPIALDMIGRIFDAMESTFPKLDWMGEVTGKRASEKIRALTSKIGYPDKWRDYSALQISRTDYFANALAERKFEHERRLAKMDAPRDMAEWLMPTPLVNAYAHQGEITFPAGILQYPFFDKDQPQAMNYGGIGAVIGHELTHHFDDQGRKYDKDGRLHEWWEPDVSKRFDERVSCVVGQYDGFEVLPELNVNGRLTAGENIADIGGVKQAYIAYKAWEKENGAEELETELTSDKLFFVAWGQNWCSVESEAFIRRRIEGDSHSPGKFRAEGPLADYPQFWETFECAEGTTLHPKDACEVW
jgi:predicted metalloendopeptidase